MAVPIQRVMGKTGIHVTTRVMALIVAAIGVKFIMTGIKNQLPGLMG
jgi:multiple antibiotic resistance protein